MRAVAVAIVVLGIGSTAALAVAGGLDATGAVILAFIVALGALAIAVAKRSTMGAVAPAECPSCGGLVSPNAPYCKHCNADLQSVRS